jgi:hypothetical protein
MIKRRSSHTVALVALVWVMTVPTINASPTQRTFSGRWVLESEPLATASTELVVRQTFGSGSALPTKVTVTRQGPSGSSTETLHVGTIGGTVAGSGGGPRTFHRVAWEDSSLVVEVETLRGQTGSRAPSELRREVWSVIAEGKLQIVITESGPARTSKTTTLIYRQASAALGRLPYAV